MNKKLLLLLIVLVFAPCKSDAGNIVGTAKIEQSAVSTSRPSSPYARSRYSGPAKVVKNSQNDAIALVYLEAHESLSIGRIPSEPAAMDQIDIKLVPHLLPVVAGRTVRFPNNDNVYHNLFSLSKIKRFDLGRYGKGDWREVTFNEVGEVPIFCDIHPTMSAVIIVLPNQYFTTVKADGDFRIDNVPEGKYTLRLWHERYDDQLIDIEVPKSGIVNVNLKTGP